MKEKEELLKNIDRLHTTELGEMRIKRNLSIDVGDVILWCMNCIKEEDNRVTKRGKNWYVYVEGCVFTINTKSYTVITAHKG